MSKTQETVESLDSWCEKWEAAQAKGIFDDAPKPPCPSSQVSSQNFFGQLNAPDEESLLKDVDAQYWKNVYQQSDHPGHAPDVAKPEVLSEVEKEPKIKSNENKLPTAAEAKKTDLAKWAATLANEPNPVESPSIGKDQAVGPTPNWTEGGKLEELIEMKLKLHDLKGKIAAALGDKKNEGIQTQINNLEKQIDELSDVLSPDFLSDYLS